MLRGLLVKATKEIAMIYAANLAPGLDAMLPHLLASPGKKQKRYLLPMKKNAWIGMNGIMAKVLANVQALHVVEMVVASTTALMQVLLSVLF